MHSTFLPLSGFDALLVHGPDARKFLQGQVSCNVDELSASQSLSGALCNLKGRVIADFRLFLAGADCCLVMEAGLGPTVQAVLAKYIVFSKARLLAAGDRFRRFGLMGNDAHQLVSRWFGHSPVADGNTVSQEGITLIKIPGLVPRYEIFQDLAGTEGDTNAVLNGLQEGSGSGLPVTWQLADMHAGIIHVTPAMSEQFLPQQLNYDVSGIINFRKGCYTGQEIVARMYYRSSAKKRMTCLSSGSANCTDQAQLFMEGEADPLEVLQVARDEQGGFHALALLPVEGVSQGRRCYCASDPQTGLQVHPLPYLPVH